MERKYRTAKDIFPLRPGGDQNLSLKTIGMLGNMAESKKPPTSVILIQLVVAS